MAAQLKRSRGWIMKQALSAWMQQEEELSRLEREAMADVDARRVVDHSVVRAWSDRLGRAKQWAKRRLVSGVGANAAVD